MRGMITTMLLNDWINEISIKCWQRYSYNDTNFGGSWFYISAANFNTEFVSYKLSGFEPGSAVSAANDNVMPGLRAIIEYY